MYNTMSTRSRDGDGGDSLGCLRKPYFKWYMGIWSGALATLAIYHETDDFPRKERKEEAKKEMWREERK